MPSIKRTPIMLIQHDWHEVLRSPNSEVWITAKYLNGPSVHGKIKSKAHETSMLYESSDGFVINGQLGENDLTVKHSESDLVTVFLSPVNVYNIHKKAIHSIAVLNHVGISSSEADDLIIWNSSRGEELLKLTGHGGPVYKCRFSPCVDVLLTAGADGSLRVWSYETDKWSIILSGHSKAVNDMAIINETNVVSASKDGKVKLWDVEEAKCLDDILTCDSMINCCCLVPKTELQAENQGGSEPEENFLIAGCENGAVYCANISPKEVMFVLNMDAPVNCCTNSKTSVLIGCENGKILNLSLENGKILNEWWESSSAVTCLMTLEKDIFIVGHRDGTCVIYSTRLVCNNYRVQLSGSNCDSIRDITRAGNYIFTGCRDSLIRKYNIELIINSLR